MGSESKLFLVECRLEQSSSGEGTGRHKISFRVDRYVRWTYIYKSYIEISPARDEVEVEVGDRLVEF